MTPERHGQNVVVGHVGKDMLMWTDSPVVSELVQPSNVSGGVNVWVLFLAMLNETTLQPYELRFAVLVRLWRRKVKEVSVLRMIVVLEPRQAPMIRNTTTRARTRTRTRARTATPKSR